MSKRDDKQKLKLQQVNRYVYKLVLKSGKTYVGQRTYYYKFEDVKDAIYDLYKGSSSYIKNNPSDVIVDKIILIEFVKDVETLDILETCCIQDEIAMNGKNCVNGNLGGMIHKFRRRFNHEVALETREKLRIKITERWENKEYRAKTTESHLGQIPWNKGKTNVYSEESKKKMGEPKKGKPSSMKGRHHTNETKEKLRNANLGKKRSEESKEKARKHFLQLNNFL